MVTSTLKGPKKDRRIEVRATTRQEDVIKRAAAVTERTVTDFMLEAAVLEAERTLADRRRFSASADVYEQFLDALDRPLESTDKFARLWSRPSPFGKPFTPAGR
jgi:uncharacterized protein (DUF1778 family)